VIEGIVGDGFQGDISVDDIAINDGPCPTSSKTLLFLVFRFEIIFASCFVASCDFESSDLCGYVNDPTNTIDWHRYQAGTDASLPSVDVSYGSSHGHFMLLKANTTSGVVNSRLITPTYPDTSGSCIRWYMLLENSATLIVRTYAFGTLNPTVLYSISGSHGKQWKLAQTTIRSGSPYQVVFQGNLNNTDNLLDSIAIDDIGIQSGECEQLGACDFEKSLCGYQHLPADFDWKRTSLNIEISRSGYYLWMDRRQLTAGRKARIESELIPNDLRCVSFYYYMDGTTGAQLNVYARDPRSDISKLIWSVDQNHGAMWVLTEITVRPNMTVNETSQFTVVYEAVVGTTTGGKNSDI
jgi:hypothetical protein